MSDTDYDFDDNEDNSPAGLRKALEKANKRAKDAEAKAAAAEDRAAKAEKTAKKSTLAEILRDKKVPQGLARFIEKDEVEATPDAVGQWLEENREFFNIPSAEQEQQEQQAEGEEQGPDGDVLPEDLVQALSLSREIDSAGVSQSAASTMQRISGLSTDPSKASYEQLVAELKAAGAPLA